MVTVQLRIVFSQFRTFHTFKCHLKCFLQSEQINLPAHPYLIKHSMKVSETEATEAENREHYGLLTNGAFNCLMDSVKYYI